MRLISSSGWKYRGVGILVFLVVCVVVCIARHNVSRETCPPVPTMKYLLNHPCPTWSEAEAEVNKWLQCPVTAYRVAQVWADRLSRFPCPFPLTDPEPARLLLNLARAVRESDPVVDGLLLRIADRCPRQFRWESIFRRLIPQARIEAFVRELQRHEAGGSQNPFVRLALFHLGVAGDPGANPSGVPVMGTFERSFRQARATILDLAGQENEAREEFSRLADDAARHGDDWLSVLALTQWGMSARGAEDPARAWVCVHRAQSVQRASAIPALNRRITFLQGLLTMDSADYSRAARLFDSLMGRAPTVRMSQVQAYSLLCLGFIADEQGNFRDAHDCYARMIAYCRRTGDEDTLVTVLLNRGALREKMNQYREAQDDYETVLTLTRSRPLDDNRILAMENLGHVYDRLGDVQRAGQLMEQVFRYYLRQGPAEAYILAGINLASFNIGQNKLESAEQILSDCSAVAETLPSPFWRSIITRGRAELRLRQDQPKEALRLINQVELTREEKSVHSLEWEIWCLKGNILLELGRKEDSRQAFERARSEYERLRSTCFDDLSGLHLRYQARDIVEGLLRGYAGDATSENAFEDEIIELLHWYRAGLPESAQTDGNSAPSEMNRQTTGWFRIQAYLRSHQAIILCLVAGTRETFSIIMSSEGMSLTRCSTVDCAAELARYHQALEVMDEHQISTAIARCLKRIIPERMKSRIQQAGMVAIMPDGRWEDVPFGLWNNFNGSAPSAELGIGTPVYVIPSLEVLVKSRSEAGLRSTYRGVLFTSEGQSDWNSLPGAAREIVDAVGSGLWKKTFRSTGIEFQNLLKQERASLRAASVLHFATHVRQTADLAARAEIVLAGQGRSVVGLNINGIRRRHWPSDLVILSGCATGVGEPFPGAGMYSVARAFLAAGSRSVLMTLWPQSDQASAAFFHEFFSALRTTEGQVGPALCAARAALHRRPEYHHPYYWGGYVHYGPPTRLTLAPEGDGAAPAALFAGLGLVFGLLAFHARRRSPRG